MRYKLTTDTPLSMMKYRKQVRNEFTEMMQQEILPLQDR
ncbi:hypothetical protein RU97_GL001157 [Enterococcus canis]|uniref:Uncharacterized protein n=1 Tax=Enterococcus canis TaxID=214095 RepID=A0A1L8RIK6_9ENTE|nr:hypothetical protein RU97_GL001157 [Enterococcus canis]